MFLWIPPPPKPFCWQIERGHNDEPLVRIIEKVGFQIWVYYLGGGFPPLFFINLHLESYVLLEFLTRLCERNEVSSAG